MTYLLTPCEFAANFRHCSVNQQYIVTLNLVVSLRHTNPIKRLSVIFVRYSYVPALPYAGKPKRPYHSLICARCCTNLQTFYFFCKLVKLGSLVRQSDSVARPADCSNFCVTLGPSRRCQMGRLVTCAVKRFAHLFSCIKHVVCMNVISLRVVYNDEAYT
jgi:hypothetical protein